MFGIKQVFSSGSKWADSRKEVNFLKQGLENEEVYEMVAKKAGGDYNAYQSTYEAMLNQAELKNAQNAVKFAQKTALSGISIGTFVYNYAAKTTRFGLRGQDIQDQLKLQDKWVNKGAGIVAAGIAGGPVAAGVATAYALIGEIISVSIQNKAYEYRRQIDEEQKNILRERIGREVYNSSRR